MNAFKTRKTLKILISLIVILFFLIQQNYFLSHGTNIDSEINIKMGDFDFQKTETSDYLPNEYFVIKVVDGDTIKIQNSESIETIRMIGVNTPESVDPRKPVQCFGIEASNKTKEILLGQKVKITQDETQQKRDKYNRLLAYVNRSSDGLFVNKFLIEEGYAYEYTYNTPYKFQLDFKNAEKYAQKNKKGLWADGACSLKN